ncbi:MAG: mycothiol system anti-sigma-R factor [Acidimicrobiales bacterium]
MSEGTDRVGSGMPTRGMSFESPTLDCNEAIHQLYDYLDGELTDTRRTEISDHLDFCAPCASAMGFEAELRQVVADHCKDHVPDSLRLRIADLIEGERRQLADVDPEAGGSA